MHSSAAENAGGQRTGYGYATRGRAAPLAGPFTGGVCLGKIVTIRIKELPFCELVVYVCGVWAARGGMRPWPLWCRVRAPLSGRRLGSVRSFCASGNANVPYTHTTSRYPRSPSRSRVSGLGRPRALYMTRVSV